MIFFYPSGRSVSLAFFEQKSLGVTGLKSNWVLLYEVNTTIVTNLNQLFFEY